MLQELAYNVTYKHKVLDYNKNLQRKRNILIQYHKVIIIIINLLQIDYIPFFLQIAPVSKLFSNKRNNLMKEPKFSTKKCQFTITNKYTKIHK